MFSYATDDSLGMPNTKSSNMTIKDDILDTELVKMPLHVREPAQIQTDQSLMKSQSNTSRTFEKRQDLVNDADLHPNSTGSRTPSPPPRSPDQLSVAKRRFPLLNVKQVIKKETPLPSRCNGITRSQSGLLQEDANAKREHTQPEIEHEQQGRITSTFRKISPANVATLLKGKKSMAFLGGYLLDKENRPSTAITDIVSSEEAEAASTPGPAYLAMRSGNSGGKKVEKMVATKDESPTGLVKSTLSARLSRPFNMDTPEGNRPFDSMYLGKRELGFHDTSGGRLSVATKQNSYSYNKQRGFDRGPGGYGGLGPSPFETPGREQEETALPHIPTPEDRAKNSLKSGLSQGSKRMVSNFLRSRRKGSSENHVSEIINQKHAAVKANEGAATSSPLFI